MFFLIEVRVNHVIIIHPLESGDEIGYLKIEVQNLFPERGILLLPEQDLQFTESPQGFVLDPPLNRAVREDKIGISAIH